MSFDHQLWLRFFTGAVCAGANSTQPRRRRGGDTTASRELTPSLGWLPGQLTGSRQKEQLTTAARAARAARCVSSATTPHVVLLLVAIMVVAVTALVPVAPLVS